MTTRYLVCGGRDFDDYALMAKALRALILHPEDATLIHGAAAGADKLAAIWAKSNGVSKVIGCPADWRIGRQAGILRNQQMLDEHAPDVVIAFPGGRGTADMIRRARAAGVVTIEVVA